MISADEEARESTQRAVEALQQWRDEIDAVNKRHLPKTLEVLEATARLVGWPDHRTGKTGYGAVPPQTFHYFLLFDVIRDALQNATKLETDIIESVRDACYASSVSSAPVPRPGTVRQAPARGPQPAVRSARPDVPKAGLILDLAGQYVAASILPKSENSTRPALVVLIIFLVLALLAYIVLPRGEATSPDAQAPAAAAASTIAQAPAAASAPATPAAQPAQ